MDKIKTGLLIKQLREEKNISRNDFAKRIGCQEFNVSSWESGFYAPEAKFLPSIAELLNITIEELMQGEFKKTVIDKETIQPQQEEKIIHKETPPKEEKTAEKPTVIEVPSEDEESFEDEEMFEEEESFEEDGTSEENDFDTDDFESEEEEDFDEEEDSYSDTIKKSKKAARDFSSLFVMCILGLIIILGVNYFNKERNIDLENYREYVSIQIKGLNATQTDCLIIITAKEEVKHFKAVIMVTFQKNLKDSIEERVEFYSINLSKGEKVQKEVKNIEGFRSLQFTFEVISISGELD